MARSMVAAVSAHQAVSRLTECLSLGAQLANLDVPEPDLAVVVLQSDVAFGKCSELLEVPELAAANQFL
jgi:hypothetical protein